MNSRVKVDKENIILITESWVHSDVRDLHIYELYSSRRCEDPKRMQKCGGAAGGRILIPDILLIWHNLRRTKISRFLESR